jgi:c-di-GMP-binding flagellar brake protein YcgR
LFTRRIYQRFILNDSLTLHSSDGSEKRLLLKDLSNGGAGVFGNSPLSVHEAVRVTIFAPAFFDKPTSREAKVAWCKQVNINAWEGGLDFDVVQ